MLCFKTLYQGGLTFLEKQILTHADSIEAWFDKAWSQTPPPLVSSVDLRHAGFKLAPVDTNLFPAGFNNLSVDLMPWCVQAMQETLKTLYSTCKTVLIIPEAHTRNAFYAESLTVLMRIFQGAGFEVKLGHWAFSGELYGLKVSLIERVGDGLQIDGMTPCMVVLNNDLTEGIPAIIKGLSPRTVPIPEMGWTVRRKSRHFELYRKIVEDFSKLIDCDPWLLFPEMGVVQQVDFKAQTGLTSAVSAADAVLARIKEHYEAHQIDKPPFLVVKPDNGTYGMGIQTIYAGKELMALNRKQRVSMSSIKGGGGVRHVLIQEGVYTQESLEDGAMAEPVIYMIGKTVVGGFYRVNMRKGADENLNAPGMQFQAFAFEEGYCQRGEGGFAPIKANRFYVYSVVARLAALAAGMEEQEQ